MRGVLTDGVYSRAPLAPSLESATQISDFCPVDDFEREQKFMLGASTSLFNLKSKSWSTSMGVFQYTRWRLLRHPWVSSSTPVGVFYDIRHLVHLCTGVHP
jgi:hypothetical protein